MCKNSLNYDNFIFGCRGTIILETLRIEEYYYEFETEVWDSYCEAVNISHETTTTRAFHSLREVRYLNIFYKSYSVYITVRCNGLTLNRPKRSNDVGPRLAQQMIDPSVTINSWLTRSQGQLSTQGTSLFPLPAKLLAGDREPPCHGKSVTRRWSLPRTDASTSYAFVF